MPEEIITHTLASGVKLEIKVTVPDKPVDPEPDPTNRFMQVGATYDPSEYTTWLPVFPKASVCRVFSANDPVRWTDGRIARLIEAKRVPFVSWKNYNLDLVDQWLDAMPSADVLPMVYATWMHEPEPKGVNPAEYKKNITAIYNRIQAHANVDRVLFGPVLTRQWTENTAGRNYTMYDPGIGDFIGCDMYANTWENKYPTPEEFTRYFGRHVASNGKDRPMWVPELGAVKMAGDSDGSQRAKWITEVLAALYEWGCEVVIWWNDMGTPSANNEPRDFRLVDEPSKSAFLAALDRYNGV